MHTLCWFLNLLYIFKLFDGLIIINIIQFGNFQLNIYTVLDIRQQKSISSIIFLEISNKNIIYFDIPY